MHPEDRLQTTNKLSAADPDTDCRAEHGSAGSRLGALLRTVVLSRGADGVRHTGQKAQLMIFVVSGP